jgi:lactoylglutathione lyase
MPRAVKLPRALVIVLRVTVGLIFVAMGSWKVGAQEYHMGGRIGELFTFMESTGLWWDLVGWTQIVAGVLLITRRFATFAALVLAGITVNIAAVSIAFWPEFATTMVLTAYALVALTLLLLHDLDKWQYIFWRHPPDLADQTAAARHSGTRGANDYRAPFVRRHHPPRQESMELGAFSVSLAVKDLQASWDFYAKLGFTQFAGDPAQHWLILRNGDCVIGPFQGMFEQNILTFNPGWNQAAEPLGSFTDVRELQRRLRADGVTFVSEADESTTGPASFVVVDPDGNPILIDQHV